MRNFFAQLARFPLEALDALRGRLPNANPAHGGEDDSEAPLLASARLDDERRAAAQRAALIKARPRTLEQRYELLEHDELADALFERLRRHVYQELDARARANPRAKAVWREAGRIAPKRHYFYLKSPGETGVLFERSGAGWVIAPCEKIAARDLFLRQGGTKDHALLYFARDSDAVPRVKSPLFGDGLSPFSVYEQKLLAKLGI